MGIFLLLQNCYPLMQMGEMGGGLAVRPNPFSDRLPISSPVYDRYLGTVILKSLRFVLRALIVFSCVLSAESFLLVLSNS